MELEIPPPNPMSEISNRKAWSGATQELPELQVMFKEDKKLGGAKIGTVLRALRTLKENIQGEIRARDLERQGAKYAKPDEDINTQGNRMKAVERIEAFLKETHLGPSLKDLYDLRDSHSDLQNLLHEVNKHPYQWQEELNSGKIGTWRTNLEELEEKINYLEKSPEFEQQIKLQEAQATEAWKFATEQLTPEELKLVGVENRIYQIRETFHAIGKDGDWRSESERDGSWKRMEEELEALKELQGTPEHIEATEKVNRIYDEKLAEIQARPKTQN